MIAPTVRGGDAALRPRKGGCRWAVERRPAPKDASCPATAATTGCRCRCASRWRDRGAHKAGPPVVVKASAIAGCSDRSPWTTGRRVAARRKSVPPPARPRGRRPGRCGVVASLDQAGCAAVLDPRPHRRKLPPPAARLRACRADFGWVSRACRPHGFRARTNPSGQSPPVAVRGRSDDGSVAYARLSGTHGVACGKRAPGAAISGARSETRLPCSASGALSTAPARRPAGWCSSPGPSCAGGAPRLPPVRQVRSPASKARARTANREGCVHGGTAGRGGHRPGRSGRR